MRHPGRRFPRHHRSRGEASVTGTTGPERQGEPPGMNRRGWEGRPKECERRMSANRSLILWSRLGSMTPGIAARRGDRLMFNRNRRFQPAALVLAFACISAFAQAPSPHEWRDYGGSPEGTRYVDLRQINKSNIDKLEPAWI